MKKSIIILLMTLFGLTQAVAQEYEYVPFVREGVKWVFYYDNPITAFSYEDGFIPYGEHYYTFEMKGDTVIDGKSYKPVHLYSSGCRINEINDTVPVYVREEDKVVYGFIPDDRRYWECPIGIRTMVLGLKLISSVKTREEFILYDFNDPATFYGTTSDDYGYDHTDTIQIGNYLRKRLQFGSCDDYIIEGIGYAGNAPGMPLNYFYAVTTGLNQVVNHLSHVIEDGEIIYKTEWYKEPEPEVSDYLPIVREGVKWVNEKVIVNHGDTTCYYYNYEFSGKDSVMTDMMNNLHDACYYYLGEHLNVEQDSLIAGLRERNQGLVTCMRNHAYEKVRSEGRQMFDLMLFTNGGSRQLYNFLSVDVSINYYLACEYYWCEYGGYDEELTRENLVVMEPVLIDGVECGRIAFIDETGEPLAYIVEGIGFDSRDMGDMLTPFTRKPDPDADYQEWCGLSHVVKDGKIIYKGMRYRHGAFTGIDEVVAEQPTRPLDPNYYNLMGQPVGTDVPTTPGIYIHQGKKICVSRMP